MNQSIIIYSIIFLFAGIQLQAQYVDILNQEKAGQKITQDEMDHFFDKIHPLEVSIQLKDTTLDDLHREAAANQLLSALPDEVTTPSEDQVEILKESMQEALDLTAPLTKKYPLPDTVYLGLLKGKIYGPSVFFTRENGIFIPTTMINKSFQTQLRDILIHEIFHIQSRFYPELQTELYKEIGFYDLGVVPDFGEDLRSRVLVNPDGTDWNYYIPLHMNGDTVMAYPVIHSNATEYSSDKPNFFQYLQFQLFPLEQADEGYRLVYEENLQGLDPKWMKPFFEQIEDNTQYIIHPDEIMADNFVLLAKMTSNEDHKELSDEGRDLLNRLAKIYEVQLEE